MEALADLADSLKVEEWRRPTDLPGWDVKDNVSHVAGLEAVILGWPQPNHELPGGLAHVRDDLGRFMEGPVDVRRAWPTSEVVAELRRVIATRRAAFAVGLPAADEKIPGMTGRPTAAAAVYSLRVFDCWAHEQDVRRATERPGNLDSDAAWVSYRRIAESLPYILGRSEVPASTSLRVTVTGPMPFAVGATMGETGSAEATTTAPGNATVVLTMDGQTLACLACGRIPPETAPVGIDGDAVLATQILRSFAITP